MEPKGEPHAFIVGGDAELGIALAREARLRDWTVTQTSRRRDRRPGRVHLDLADPSSVSGLPFPPPPCRVFLLAAITSLKTCRQQPTATAAINANAVALLARRAAESQTTPVLVSTNLVFDGSQPEIEIDAPHKPKTRYGQQKAIAEQATLAAGGVVVRPTKVLPPQPTMLATWRDALRRGEPVEAFDDLWFAPVPMSSVVRVMLDAPLGIHHLSATHDISYYEAALHVAQRVGAEPTQVIATRAADADIPAEERPRHTTLACDDPVDPYTVLDAALGLA
ncbi:MAG: sugar nucleotide-binding protein [Planctomycetota bacterium]